MQIVDASARNACTRFEMQTWTPRGTAPNHTSGRSATAHPDSSDIRASSTLIVRRRIRERGSYRNVQVDMHMLTFLFDSISGLVAEHIVGIDVARMRSSADAE